MASLVRIDEPMDFPRVRASSFPCMFERVAAFSAA